MKSVPTETNTAETFAREVDRQIEEYGCVSDEAIENVMDDLIYNQHVDRSIVQMLADGHFNYRQVES
jgi:hypothetical protein